MSGQRHRRALASSADWKWKVTEETFLCDGIDVLSLFTGKGQETHWYLAVLKSLAYVWLMHP